MIEVPYTWGHTPDSVWTCRWCGAVVADRIQHDGWHQAIANLTAGSAPNADPVVWRYVSPADGAVVFVMMIDGHWHSAVAPVGPWERDDGVPTWPGAFRAWG